VQEIRRLLPAATVTLRIHKLAWKRDTQAPTLILCGVLVTSKVGPFTLRREYAAPLTGLLLDDSAVVETPVGGMR